MGITLDEMPDCTVVFTDALKVLSEGIMSILKIDPIVLLGYFKGFIPFSTGLVKLAK